MYKEWFRKTLKLERLISGDAKSHANWERIGSFLSTQGFRDISKSEQGISAIRGLKCWGNFIPGDPRRLYHVIQILPNDRGFSITIHIDSYFGLGTKYDTAVFLVELDMLQELLKTGHLDQTPLIEAHAKRRKSDWKTLFILIAVGFVLGIIALLVLVVLICLGIVR